MQKFLKQLIKLEETLWMKSIKIFWILIWIFVVDCRRGSASDWRHDAHVAAAEISVSGSWCAAGERGLELKFDKDDDKRAWQGGEQLGGESALAVGI